MVCVFGFIYISFLLNANKHAMHPEESIIDVGVFLNNYTKQ